METAHSWQPESAGSKSADQRRQGVDYSGGQRVVSGHAPPDGLAALERAKAGGDECAVSSSIAGRSLPVGRNGNLGDRRGEESCPLFRIANQQGRDENAVSPGSAGRSCQSPRQRWPRQSGRA